MFYKESKIEYYFVDERKLNNSINDFLSLVITTAVSLKYFNV